MIKAIVFDFDGVIADTESERFSCLKSILHTYGYRLKKADFLGMIGEKTAGGIACMALQAAGLNILRFLWLLGWAVVPLSVRM